MAPGLGLLPAHQQRSCAVGVMMDDVRSRTARCLHPGQPQGAGPRPPWGRRLLRRHRSRRKRGIDFSQGRACTGKAGSISIHHVLTIHGSAVNTSAKPRRLLLFQYRRPMPGRSSPRVSPRTGTSGRRASSAASAIPLCRGDGGAGAPAAARPKYAGSIYETQRALGHSYFAAPGPASRTAAR